MTGVLWAGDESPADELLRPTNGESAWVTGALAAAMLLCSVATLFEPNLREVLGGVGYLPYRWQVFTSAFEHGWPGFPLPVHLILNLGLLWKIAPPVERLLGSARFLALTLLAILFYWLARSTTGIDANGASVFIWSYAPILFLIWGPGRRKHRAGVGAREIRGLLWIVWVAVPVGLAVVLALGGTDPWLAFPLGNVFHVSATLAGLVGVATWRGIIQDRLRTGDFSPRRADRMAQVAAMLIPGFIGSIVVLAAAGVVAA